MISKSAGIYCILSPSGKRYVGQAYSLRRRQYTHRYALRHGRHANAALQACARKYGVEALQFLVLEECDVECLDERETFWMQQYHWRQLYNIRKTVGVRGRPKGKPLSEAQRAALIAANTGRVKTPEERARIGAGHRGKTVSAETRAKLSTALRGTTVPLERKLRISAASNTSGARGVSYCARLGKWSAYATPCGFSLSLGYFTCKVQASAAREQFDLLTEGLTRTDELRIREIAKALRPPRQTGLSGIRGVSFNKASGRWHAYTGSSRKRRHLGTFDTAAAAAEAVATADNEA